MLDQNKIYHGDSVEMMKKLDDNSIDLTITSPPYDTLRTYKGAVSDKVYDNHFSFPFVDIANELYRITKDGGIVVWVVNDMVINGGESGNSFRQALKFQEIGFKIYDTMIYQKNGAAFHETSRYDQVFEYMFVLLKGDKPKTVNIIKDKINKWAGSKTFGTPSNRQTDGSIKKSKGGFTVAKYGSRYNIWYIVNGKGYGGDKLSYLHPACVDTETECLTIDGWKKFNELTIGNEILSYNLDNDILEWDSLKNIHISEYNGDIYEMNGRRLSIIVTPNHRNVIYLNGKISIKETTDLKGRHDILTSCPNNSNSEELNDSISYLLGIILTDGCLSGGYATISQDYEKNKETFEKILYHLNSLEIEYSVHKRRRYFSYNGNKIIENMIRINEKDLDKHDYYNVSYCSDIRITDKNLNNIILKYIPNKKITNSLFKLNTRSLNKIIDGIIDGDGTIKSDDGNSNIITGKYEEFHSNLQILCFLAGYTADCIKNANSGKIYTQLTNNRQKSLRNAKESLINKKPYNGKV